MATLKVPEKFHEQPEANESEVQVYKAQSGEDQDFDLQIGNYFKPFSSQWFKRSLLNDK